MAAERCPHRCLPPFLVDIQNVDISGLDFQQGAGNGLHGGSTSGAGENGTKSKSRHVTFVEATTLFLLVGSTSGSVYLFSRDSLEFLLMIPFKGGKVCHISVSNDEFEVAVASIRGRVSIYRMSPNIHLEQSHISMSNKQGLLNGSYSSSSRPVEALFRHLYDIPHHLNNEITEMKWSANGKFLFVGDNQGVISQLDVGSLEEFPRPPPSRVILKLLSRILQIDCSFPYLAVSTLNATFLCDLEKEDFTRIQLQGLRENKRDIKSGGLCILCQDNRMFLLIGEVGTGSVFRCGMDGSVISCVKVGVDLNNDIDFSSPRMIRNPVTCFDPKNSEPVGVITSNNNKLGCDLNFSPGKMYPTDNGQFIISVSSNRIFVYDAKTCRILLWNDEFNRINSLKIIANYGFLWYANKLQVFALTPFRPYGKQLFKAGLKSVLENWISYAVTSLGYQYPDCEEEDDDNEDKTRVNSCAVKMFRDIMSPIDEEDEFCEFVSSRIPFDLIDPEVKRKLLQEESYDKKLQRIVKQSAESISLTLAENLPFPETIQKIFKALQEFYSIQTNSNSSSPHLIPLTQNEAETPDLTLLQVLSSTHIFLRHPQLLSLKQDFTKYSLQNDVIDKVAGPILNFILQGLGSCSGKNASKNCALLLEFPSEHCKFLHYANSLSVQKYFSDLGISLEMLSHDALIADVIILLLPLVSDLVLYKCLKQLFQSHSQLSGMFFTWMTIMTFFGDKTHSLPFSGLLRTIQNPAYFDKLVEEVVSSVYREVIFPREDGASEIQTKTVTCFTHFITFTILYSKCSEISKYRSESLLLTLFPLKRGDKHDLVKKIIHLSTLNPFLFKMFYKACLADGKSFKMCGCGIQAGYGSLEGVVPPFQRAIEEGILHKLVEQYFDNQQEDFGEINGHQHLEETRFANPVHLFAIQRCLIVPYLQSTVADDILPDDHIKISMILRSGLCGALQHLGFNLDNLKVLRDALKNQNGDECHPDKVTSCLSCGMELSISHSKVFTPISMDCVGVWMMENVGSISKFMQLLETIGLNNREEFSLRFYQLIIKRDEFRRQKGKRKQRQQDSILYNPTCSPLHQKP